MYMKVAKTNAERQREFRARKKYLSPIIIKKAKTGAQRQREYKFRQKFGLPLILPRAKSAAERKRLQRERDRLKQLHALNYSCTDRAVPVTSTASSPTATMGKTNAERGKEYRERLRALKPAKVPKTGAQRTREWRARISNKNHTSQSLSSTSASHALPIPIENASTSRSSLSEQPPMFNYDCNKVFIKEEYIDSEDSNGGGQDVSRREVIYIKQEADSEPEEQITDDPLSTTTATTSVGEDVFIKAEPSHPGARRVSIKEEPELNIENERTSEEIANIKEKLWRAEYMREYRAKNKERKNRKNGKQKKSRAEYMRKYRAKIKESKNRDKHDKKKQLRAEYMRKYRAKINERKNRDKHDKQKPSKAEYMREYRARIKGEKIRSGNKPPPLSSTERWRRFIAKKRNSLAQATSSGQERIIEAVNRPTDSINNQLITHQQENSPRPSTSRNIVKSKPPPLTSTERANKCRNKKRKSASMDESLIIDKRHASQNSLSTYYKHGLIINNSSTLNEQNNVPRESYIAPVINISENSLIMIHEYRTPTNLIVTTPFVNAMPRSESSDVPVNLNINNKNVRLGNASEIELRLPPILSPDFVAVESIIDSDETICINNDSISSNLEEHTDFVIIQNN